MASTATVDLSWARLNVVGFVKSDTFDLTIDFVPSGSFDFTGAAGNMQLVNKSTNALVADLDTAGGEILFPTSDQIQIVVEDTVTALWPVCTLVGDIQVLFQDGTTRTLLYVEIKVEKPVTAV